MIKDFNLIETNKIILSEIYNKYLNKLEELEKDRFFCRHNYEHFISVARICYILKLEEKVDVDKDMIYSTALLHDLGRIDEIKSGINHSIASVDIAKEILEVTDYNDSEKERILNCIAYHRTKDKAEDEFFNIFYKSDKLSRDCLRCLAYGDCNWSYEKKNHIIKY